MKSPNLLADVLAEVLPRFGFRSRSTAWYRDVPIGTLVVELQESEWGQQYYLNLGVYVRRLGKSPKNPRAHQCHLNARAEVLDLAQQERWREILDLESALDTRRRRLEFSNLLVSQAIPFLESLGTRSGILEALNNGLLSHAAVTLSLKRHIGAE